MTMTTSFEELEHDEGNKCDVSLQRFVEDLDYAIRWEQLNGCQEAAFEDIPATYSDCLSIFSTHILAGPEDEDGPRVQNINVSYQNLLSLLGTANLNQQWPLPPPLYALSEEDQHVPESVIAHDLSQVQLSAVVFPSKPDTQTQTQTELETEKPTTYALPFDRPTPHTSKLPTRPILPSTVVTSSKEIFGRQVSFYTLRRYNRLATTSILRTAYALGIDIPVIGILVAYNQIAIHIDWYQIVHGEFTCNSAFYTTNTEEDLKIWDITQPSDADQITQIFSNIRNYTINHFKGTFTPPIRDRDTDKSVGLQQRIAALRLDDNIPSPPSTPDFSF